MIGCTAYWLVLASFGGVVAGMLLTVAIGVCIGRSQGW